MSERRLPAPAAALLRAAVPVRWADTVEGDLEAEWRTRRERGEGALRAGAWATDQALRIAGRFAAESALSLAGVSLREAGSSLRGLLRQPRFAVAATLTLGLGAAAQIVAFTVVDRVLLQPLPYADPERLVELRGRAGAAGSETRTLSSVDYGLWREGLGELVELAAYQVATATVRLAGDAGAHPVPIAWVSPELFDVLGVRVPLGRGFVRGEGRLGGPGVAVVADHVWRARFGGRPDLLGRELLIDGRLHRVVGVAPVGLEFPPGIGVWVARDPESARLREMEIEFASLRVLGRLRGAAPPDAVAQELAVHGARLAREAGREHAPHAAPLLDAFVGPARDALRLGWAAVAFLSLLACANASGLLLARTATRTRELTVRAALGASAPALARLVVVEAVLLALAGGTLGLALAALGLRLFANAEPGALPRLAGVELSWTGAAFAAALSLAVSVLIGAAPALAALRTSASGAAASVPTRHSAFGLTRFRLGAGLVTAQLAITAALLVTAGMTGWGVLRQLLNDPGYRRDGVVVVALRPELAPARAAASGALYQPLMERLAAVPGATVVAMADHLPPAPWAQQAPVALDGESLGEERAPVRTLGVSEGYFAALAIPLVAGRPFTTTEVARAAPVVVIDTLLAARAGGAAALGRRLVLHGRVHEVIGIAPPVRQGPLDEAPTATLYRPLPSGAYASGAATFLTEMFALVRTDGDALTLLPAVRQRVAEGPRVAEATDVGSLEQRLWASLRAQGFQATLAVAFALLGLGLAAFGVYGLVSFFVQQASTEIGVRVALGARRGHVAIAVLGHGARLAALGLGLGLASAPVVAALVASRLPGVAAASPGLVAGVLATLAVAVVAACALPAWRATRVDPVATLRCDPS